MKTIVFLSLAFSLVAGEKTDAPDKPKTKVAYTYTVTSCSPAKIELSFDKEIPKLMESKLDQPVKGIAGVESFGAVYAPADAGIGKPVNYSLLTNFWVIPRPAVKDEPPPPSPQRSNEP